MSKPYLSGCPQHPYGPKVKLPKRTEAKCLLVTAEKIPVTVALAECYMNCETDEVRIRLMRNVNDVSAVYISCSFWGKGELK